MALLVIALGALALLMIFEGRWAPEAEPGRDRVLMLQPDTLKVQPGLWLDMLEDPDHRLTMDELVVQGDALPWRASQRTVPSLGLSNSTHWFRLRLDNRADPALRWVLTVAFPPLQHVDVYVVERQAVLRAHFGGNALPMAKRPAAHALHVFPLQIPREGALYVRVRSQSSMSVPLMLWQAEAFAREDARTTLLQGGFIGMMLGLVVFNWLIGLVNRDRVHLYYGVCSTAYLAYFLSNGGLGPLHLWPESPGLSPTVTIASVAIGGAASCLFTYRLFAHVGRNSRIRNGLFGVAVLCLLVLVGWLAQLLSHRASLAALLVLNGMSCLLFPVAALTADRRGVFKARYFVIGWSFLMLSVFVTILSATGVLSGRWITMNIPGMGFAVSTLLTSVALAVRLRELKSENETALAERLHAEQAAALAREEALRAEVRASKAAGLAEALATLEDLGRIGREITGNLDSEAVFQTLHRHVQRLMDGHAFALFQMDEALTTRRLILGIEHDQRLPPIQAAMVADDPALRCVRERRAVLQGFSPGEEGVVSGTAETLSVMYAPLYLGERLLGVLTVQSARAQAYGEREVAIFETLCAYAAIALANAETFQALRAAQARIVQQEKMATLGVLTAGMAHEINNPAHFALLAGQNAAAQVASLRGFIDGLLSDDTDPSIGQAFKTRFEQILDSLRTNTEGIERIADVIRRLRAEHPEGSGLGEATDLVALLESAWQTWAPSARVAIAMETDFQCRPMPACRVAEVKQMFLALLSNAHDAIELVQRQGCVRLAVHERGTGSRREAVIEVQDNGCGIESQHLDRVFDPFFTTKPVGHGMGLGLSMARDVAEGHGWRLRVTSTPGEGAVFSVHVPL